MAKSTMEPKPKAAYVHVDGPFSGGISERTGDEFPEWSVTICADDDSELAQYSPRSFDAAFALGQQIARDRRIEFVNDATRS